MLKPIALTLLGLLLLAAPINAQDDGETEVADVIKLENLDLEVLGDGNLLIRFTVKANLPSNVNLQRSDYAINFWYDHNQDPANPNIDTISSTGTTDSFDVSKPESLSIGSWCSNIAEKTPVLMSLDIGVRGVVDDGSEVFREVRAFHVDVSDKVADCANR